MSACNKNCPTQVRAGMTIDGDLPIQMDDDQVLRAHVLRSIAPGQYA